MEHPKLEKDEEPANAINWALIGIAVGLIVLFLVGVVGSQRVMQALGELRALRADYEQLSLQFADLWGTGRGTSPSEAGRRARVALVDTARVFKDHQGFAEAQKQFSEERDRKQKDLEKLERDRDAGRITQQAFTQRQADLLLELQKIDERLSAPIQRKMIEIIRQIGSERGYQMIFNNQEGNLTVLYSDQSEVEDITDEVIRRMDASP
jgi:Skp family chaperone for outer membrane proteins